MVLNARRTLAWTIAFVVAGVAFADCARGDEREGAVSGEKPATVQAIDKALAGPVDFEIVDQPLDELAARIAEEFRINIHLQLRAMDEAGVSPRTPVTLRAPGITLRSALNLVLDELDLTWVVRDEVLLMTTHEVAESMEEARVYQVRDLVQYSPADLFSEPSEDYDSLIEIIMTTVSPEKWREVSVPSEVKEMANLGVIVIRQSQHVHEQVAELLASLPKKGSPLPVAKVDENDATLHVRVHRLPYLPAYSDAPEDGEGGGVFSVPNQAADAQPDAEADANSPLGVLAQFGGGRGRGADPRPLAEELAKIIPEMIEPESWQAAGGEGSIHAFHGTLIVRQTTRVHKQIASLLRDLAR